MDGRDRSVRYERKTAVVLDGVGSVELSVLNGLSIKRRRFFRQKTRV